MLGVALENGLVFCGKRIKTDAGDKREKFADICTLQSSGKYMNSFCMTMLNLRIVVNYLMGVYKNRSLAYGVKFNKS